MNMERAASRVPVRVRDLVDGNARRKAQASDLGERGTDCAHRRSSEGSNFELALGETDRDDAPEDRLGRVERALGVIDVDLFVPDLNFVFGLAEGDRAVIALSRLRAGALEEAADPRLFRQRVAKEAVHELGHTYGLGHCPNRRCVMAFSNSLHDTDVKSREFCTICIGLLGLPQR
jgi:predicted Zn-dependent protease